MNILWFKVSWKEQVTSHIALGGLESYQSKASFWQSSNLAWILWKSVMNLDLDLDLDEVAQELPENYLQKIYPKLQSGSISRNFDKIVKSSNTLPQKICLSRILPVLIWKWVQKGNSVEARCFILEKPVARSRKTPGGQVRGDLGHPQRLILRHRAWRVVPEVHQPYV